MNSFASFFFFLPVIALIFFVYEIFYKTTLAGSFKGIKSPLIIFDFDGTLCPSYPLLIEQVNVLADEYSLKKIKPSEAEAFRNMTPKQIMNTLGVSNFRLPFLLRKARQNVKLQLLTLEPVPGMVELLQKLKRRGYSLGILSSNSSKNIQAYLEKYEIDFFDFVYTGNHVFEKTCYLKTILKKSNLDPKKDCVIYIGDEIRDMEAARQSQIMSLAVSWGYQASSLLKTSHPDLLIESPSDLLPAVIHWIEGPVSKAP